MPDEPPVWMTRVLQDAGNLRYINYHVEGDLETRRMFSDRASSYKMRDWSGVTLPDQLFYDESRSRSYRDGMPDIFTIIDGIPVISERMHDLLGGFRLGADTRFHEVPFYERDRTTRRPERVWLMNVATALEAVRPEASEGLTDLLPGGVYESASLDDPPDLAIDLAACADVDLWVDPQIRSYLFLSAPLRTAIVAAKLKARYWHWSPCRAA
jgi:hypothetical protein